MSATTASLTERIRSVPADLAGVVVLVALANYAIFGPLLSDSFVRILAGLLFVLVVPGYAFVSALYPETGSPPKKTEKTGDTPKNTHNRTGGAVDSPRGIDRWERGAFSVALSLVTVPILALSVTLSPLLFTTETVFITINLFIVLCVGIALKRRLDLHPQRRFRVSVVDWYSGKRRSLAMADSRSETLLSVGLAIAVLFAVGTFGFAVIAPQDGETYTGFSVLSEGDDGDLVAAEYPDTFTIGEPQQLHIAIENHEHVVSDYEVVVQIQRVDRSSQEAVVTERSEIDRFSTQIENGDRWVDERSLTVPEGWAGSDHRIQFLLYRGSAAEQPTDENAYRDLHIWIDVESPS